MPRAVSIQVCNRLDVDAVSGQTSLIGIFHGLHFAHFPSPPIDFTAYAALYDGVGEGIIYCPLELKLRGVYFPVPGRYTMRLALDDEVIAERLLTVNPT